MNLGQTFNVNELPEGDNFDPLPAGWYPVEIEEAEVRPNNAQTGELIKVKYKVIGEKYQNRCVFDNINIRNPSQECERIGRQTLGSVCRAIGLTSISDSNQLIGGKLEIRLTVKTDPNYPGNNVKGFKALGGAPPQSSAPAGFQNQQQNNNPGSNPPAGSNQSTPAAAGSAPPWAR